MTNALDRPYLLMRLSSTDADEALFLDTGNTKAGKT